MPKTRGGSLEAQNAQLKKTLAERLLDVATLKEMLGNNFRSPVQGGDLWTAARQGIA
ncbi:hypothetical protein J5474_16600 [Sagittula sp. M10.9X]|uniref:Uncharacterized protein n=1 Tax=Sagittula salina TaxID=2820268 RepID=A0A940MSA3_9RHOB|nr:hypothetical protein [Sagittula salina]